MTDADWKIYRALCAEIEALKAQLWALRRGKIAPVVDLFPPADAHDRADQAQRTEEELRQLREAYDRRYREGVAKAGLGPGQRFCT